MGTVDVLVIGAGYWGASIADHARRDGKTVLVIDDADPASGSRNASAICDPAAYKSSVFARYLPAGWGESLHTSYEWLMGCGAYRVRENFVNSFAGTTVRRGADCLYLRHPDDLTKYARPRIRGKVEAGTVGAAGVTVRTGGREYTGRNLVVAAGYRTDEVLGVVGVAGLGVGRLYGRGLIARGSPAVGYPIPVSVMIRPYCKHTVREWPGGYKVGDTAEERPNDNRLEDLRTVGRTVLTGYDEGSVSAGFRPVLDRFTVEKVAPRVVVATGGHRLGLGLAGLVGRKVVEAIR